jgi:hypothetical protein
MTLDNGQTKRLELIAEYTERLEQFIDAIIWDRIETAQSKGRHKFELYALDLPPRPDELKYPHKKSLKIIASHIRLIDGLNVKEKLHRRRWKSKLVIMWKDKQ